MEPITTSLYSLQSLGAWEQPVFPLHLSQDTVHVWRFWLHQPDSRVHDCFQQLSPHEQRRTASFYSVDNRKRFVIARGMLRRILSFYLNTTPTQLKFNYTPGGKPFLKRSATDDPALEFNLTHAQDLALCAVTVTRRVGIDVEWVQDRPQIQSAISRFFSPQDATRITRLSKRQRVNAFYEAWTRTEARMKAVGTGIDGPLLLADPRVSGGFHATSDDGLWTTVSFEPSINYVATLVIEGHNLELQYLQYPLAYDDQDQSNIPVMGE